MKKLILAVIILQLFCFPVFSADFFTGARSAGIGLPFFILADDPSGTLYNPAGLGFTNSKQYQLMYNKISDYYLGSTDGSFYNKYYGAAFHKPDLGTLGINFSQTGTYPDYLTFQKTSYFSASFGREFADGLSFGSLIKYMKESHHQQRSAIDIDLGGIYRDKSGLIFGASVENILRTELSPIAYGLKENLPRRERIGGGYFYEASTYQAVFAVASQFEQSGLTEDISTAIYGVGSEWWFNQYGKHSFGVRAGYNFGQGALGDLIEDYSSPSFGLSLNTKFGFNDLRVDYNWQLYPYESVDGSSPANHYIAFSYGWGGVPSYNKAREEVYYQEPVVVKPRIIQGVLEPQAESDDYDESVNKFSIDHDTNFESYNFQQYDVEIRSINISRLDFKRVIFYFSRKHIIKSSAWKLYVFKAKIKNWNSNEIDRWVLKTIDGRGLPPLNIAWDGITDNGELLSEGGYYAVLTAEDSDGLRFATKWHKFHID